MSATPVLHIEQLSKRYGSIQAVQGLSLTVHRGEIYGILGPNGSGKTTTLAMLLDVVKPDSGSYQWFGEPPSAATRRRIGAILETPNLYPYMDAVQNLTTIAHIKKVPSPRIHDLLELVGLSERARWQFRTYSLGMKQRLAIAAALIGDPEVLIFDEPTNGLDPQGIADVRTLLHRIANQGRTIFLASHIIDEVERICSHVAIMKRGQLIASGSVAELLQEQPVVEIGANDSGLLRQAIVASNMATEVRPTAKEGLLQVVLQPNADIAQLNSYLVQRGVPVNHLYLRKKSLEVAFLERTR